MVKHKPHHNGSREGKSMGIQPSFMGNNCPQKKFKKKNIESICLLIHAFKIYAKRERERGTAIREYLTIYPEDITQL